MIRLPDTPATDALLELMASMIEDAEAQSEDQKQKTGVAAPVSR